MPTKLVFFGWIKNSLANPSSFLIPIFAVKLFCVVELQLVWKGNLELQHVWPCIYYKQRASTCLLYYFLTSDFERRIAQHWEGLRRNCGRQRVGLDLRMCKKLQKLCRGGSSFYFWLFYWFWLENYDPVKIMILQNYDLRRPDSGGNSENSWVFVSKLWSAGGNALNSLQQISKIDWNMTISANNTKKTPAEHMCCAEHGP